MIYWNIRCWRMTCKGKERSDTGKNPVSLRSSFYFVSFKSSSAVVPNSLASAIRFVVLGSDAPVSLN